MTTANAIAMPVVDAPPALSELLRASTSDQHRRAETRTFISALMGGELALEDYVRYLAQLAHVYEALESRDASDDPAPLGDPRLARLAAIESDLAALGVADWRERHPALPSTAAYAARLREVAAGGVPEYLAHHYTRYLGDLSGGQAIGTLMGRHYSLPATSLTMWDFAELGKTKPYKDAYRRLLDQVAATGGDEQIVVDETMEAFRLNGALLVDLTEATDNRAVPVA